MLKLQVTLLDFPRNVLENIVPYVLFQVWWKQLQVFCWFPIWFNMWIVTPLKVSVV